MSKQAILSKVNEQFHQIQFAIEADLALPSIEACLQSLDRNSFDTMTRMYGRAGGLVEADEILGLLRSRTNCAQPLSGLARWIVARSIISFQWQSRTLVPLFQFSLCDMSMRIGVRMVIDELVDVYDDWDLATWFVRPNTWMQYTAPVDTITNDPGAVLQAARADRFVARG